MIRDRLRRFPTYFQPFDWHHMVVCVPGMLACLLYGLVTRDTVSAAIGAGAAFSVGFGLRRQRKFRAMAGAVALMTAATLIGSFTGSHFILFVLLAAAAAAGCACLALVDEDIWWVALQATIALLVASHYAGSPKAAWVRSSIVLGAGVAQMGLVLLIDRLIPRGHPKPVATTPIPATTRAMTIYGLVSALSVSGALLLAYGLRLDKAYWAPMTALIVLKPKFHLTRQRGWERLLGNLAGCLAAIAVTLVLPPVQWFDSVLLILGAGASYALLKARYAAFSLAVSFTAMMLLYTAHASAVQGAEQRLYATAIGGLVSIGVMWLASRTVAKDYRI